MKRNTTSEKLQTYPRYKLIPFHGSQSIAQKRFSEIMQQIYRRTPMAKLFEL